MSSPPAPATLGAPSVAPPQQLEPWGVQTRPVAPRRLFAWTPVSFAVLLAAAGALAYLLAAPPAADLAAASYRAELFARVGFALWDNGWHGGHALLGYSVLSPPLGAILGVRTLLALSTVLAAGFFAAIAQDAFERGAAFATAGCFALSLSGEMLSGRVPYALGLAIALASLLALQRRHTAAALCLAALSSVSSPLAGAFLALAALAVAVGDKHVLRRAALALAACALAPIALLALAFPEGGYEPFAAGAFWPELAVILAIALVIPREWRTLRIGVALYALAFVAAYWVHTPVGGNAARLGALLAAPLAVGVLWGRRPLLLALIAPALLYWQLATPLDDLAKVLGDPSVNASYYAPLRADLERLSKGAPTRVEIPMTGAHWESSLLTTSAGDAAAPGLMLARGWERQLDTRYAALFYRPHLSPAAYREWLDENAVAYVALPDVRLDESAWQEAALIRGGLPYLRELWRSRHWRLFAVRDAPALAQPPARLVAVGVEDFALQVPSPGSYPVRVRFTPYWALTRGRGCVREAPGGWTAIDAAAAGRVRVDVAFTAERVVEHGARCR